MTTIPAGSSPVEGGQPPPRPTGPKPPSRRQTTDIAKKALDQPEKALDPVVTLRRNITLVESTYLPMPPRQMDAPSLGQSGDWDQMPKPTEEKVVKAKEKEAEAPPTETLKADKPAATELSVQVVDTPETMEEPSFKTSDRRPAPPTGEKQLKVKEKEKKLEDKAPPTEKPKADKPAATELPVVDIPDTINVSFEKKVGEVKKVNPFTTTLTKVRQYASALFGSLVARMEKMQTQSKPVEAKPLIPSLQDAQNRLAKQIKDTQKRISLGKDLESQGFPNAVNLKSEKERLEILQKNQKSLNKAADIVQYDPGLPLHDPANKQELEYLLKQLKDTSSPTTNKGTSYQGLSNLKEQIGELKNKAMTAGDETNYVLLTQIDEALDKQLVIVQRDVEKLWKRTLSEKDRMQYEQQLAKNEPQSEPRNLDTSQ